MFDCGMHMGYNDHRRFPNFSYISKTGQFTQVIDAVIISHLCARHPLDCKASDFMLPTAIWIIAARFRISASSAASTARSS